MPQTDVLSVLHERGAFLVSTSGGSFRARAVVVASGQCDVPFIPAVARSISRRVLNLHSSQYRSPLGIPEGGVLVVGASASGVQIADELRRSGREVTLAVGRHTRAPRMWRGHDIFWWMERAGILGERTRDMPDADAAKRQPALQLAGRPDRSNVDLCTLQAMGVRLSGRVVAAMGDRIAFADDLPAVVTLAQAKLERLLARIDAFAGFGRISPHDAIAPVDLSRQAPLSLSAEAENVRTVIWATGYRRAFPWLGVAGAVGHDGEIAHLDGVTAVPGLYALGFRLLRKRDSNFIGGVGSDAVVLAQQIAAWLGQSASRAA
jgi:putative flavoprotein involved in K+ transport